MFGTKFWDQIGSKVADKWVERLLSPALVFWAGGILAYATAFGWTSVEAHLKNLDTGIQVAVVFGGLVIIAGSVVVAESIQFNVLRLLEGYWPSPLRPIRTYLTKRIKMRIVKMRSDWSALADRHPDKTDRAPLTIEELEKYANLDASLAAYPAVNRLLPTLLGNRLRAAEDYAWHRYGLATGIVWPRLWGVMPERTQKELTQSRGRLDAAVRLVLWSLLFLVWTPWAWYWVIPVALLGMTWGYWRALEAASVYGDLLRAAFDLNRSALYRTLRWSLPDNPREDYQSGLRLTSYLWRGSRSNSPTFTPHESS